MSNGKMLDIGKLAMGSINANNILNLGGYSQRILYPSPMEGYSPNESMAVETPRSNGENEPGNYGGSILLKNSSTGLGLDEVGGDRTPSNLVTADTTNYSLGQPVNQSETSSTQEGGVSEEKKEEIEQVANGSFSIQELLNKLKELGSLQPGDNREGLFQLDTIYKQSSPEYGIPGSPAEHPMADQRALTTFNMGYPIQGNE